MKNPIIPNPIFNCVSTRRAKESEIIALPNIEK